MALLRCFIKSKVLEMNTSVSVVFPEHISESSKKEINKVYLLHGLEDDSTGWLRYTSVERYAKKYDLCLIIPEVQRSFYTDMEYGIKYYSYINEELPEIMSNIFSLTLANTYVMGLSMGGYGSFKLVLNNPKRYSGCAMFSSVIELQEEVLASVGTRRNEFTAIFGNKLQLPENCDINKLLNKVNVKDLPKFYITCGEGDAFLEQNTKFSKILRDKGANVKYETWKGLHDWEFWDKSISNAFTYFFESKNKAK